MGRIADKIASAVATEIAERSEWDEPPGLYFLYLEGGEPRLSQVSIPDRVWAQDRPPQVLDAMSRVMDEWGPVLAAIAPAGLHGAGFYCESWMVEQPEPGTAERSEVQAAAHAHRLHERPDKVEARSMWAVDRAGITYGAVLRRGIDAEPQTQVSYPGPGRRLSGTIPAALERIVAALLAITL